MDDSDNAQAQPAAQPVWDSGVSDETVVISAPVHTVNWALLGMAALFAFWVYSQLDTRDAPWHEGEDDDEDD